MNRLTVRKPNGAAIRDCVGCALRAKDCCNPNMCGDMYINALAKYEETGLTAEQCAMIKAVMFCGDPDKAERILEILSADRDGRLFVSEVSVGQTVFIPINDEANGGWYVAKEKITVVASDGRFMTNDEWWAADDLGNDVFLTLGEARQAIEEAKKDGRIH